MAPDRDALCSGVPFGPGGGLTLMVTSDGLEAIVTGDIDGNSAFIKKDMRTALKEMGIVYGILPEPEQRGTELIVARGTGPQKGEDAKIIITARSWREKENSLKQEEENRDLRNIYSILNVSAGELIARRVPPEKGRDGLDLFGEEIPGITGEWISMKPGIGVELAGPHRMVAVRDGCLIIDEEGVFHVHNTWTIEGDIDLSTGNIEFWGRFLEIKGSVQADFIVDVTGSLLIHGNVEDGATILAGGDVEVKGVIRSRRTCLKTGADLTCGAVEYAEIFVAGDLYVSDYLLDARCFVEGDVSVTDGKGLIAGGQIRLGGSLAARTLGTEAYVPTKIEAGYAPLAELHHVCLENELKTCISRLKQVKEGIGKIDSLQKRTGKIDPRYLKIQGQLKEAEKNLNQARERLYNELRTIETVLGELDKACIKVQKQAYPSVTLHIAGVEKRLSKPLQGPFEARFVRGTLAIRPISTENKGSETASQKEVQSGSGKVSALISEK